MENQKDYIAETFQKHFNHHGFKKTSVDDVAKELKMSKKTIYKFFSSKEKIFYYVISKVAKQYCQKMEKKLSGSKSATAKLEQLIHMIFDEASKWLKSGNNAFEFKYKYEMAEIAFKDAYNSLVEKIIIDGINNGEFQIKNASLILSFINGIFSESMRLLGSNPDIVIVDDVNESILKLLR